MLQQTLVLGAVAYDPKVVTIWEGFRRYFGGRGFPLDYVLYSNYERQVDALLAGHIHVAWNSPLAWVRCERAAAACGLPVQAVAMRDTDRDVRSVIVVRSASGLKDAAELRGRVVAVGASDSPQATLLPLAHMLHLGLTPDVDFRVLRFDVLTGLHGDHVGGERDAARALIEGRADAACMLEANYLAFLRDGLLPPLATVVLARTEPYDHCNMTVGPAAPAGLTEGFTSLLLSMSYQDPDVRTLFDMEGLQTWLPARVDRYGLLTQAVDALGLPDGAQVAGAVA